jgi:AraC-like DNA-binding protein
MEARRPVLLVGLGSQALDLEGVEVRVVPLARVRHEVDACREGCVVVLGPDALGHCEPESLATSFRSPQLVTLAVAHGVEPEIIAAWARGIPMTFVRTGDLSRAVREAASAFQRDWLPCEEWARVWPGQEPEFLGALEGVQTLPIVDVNEWAMHLGMSRSTLYRLCMRACGLPPEHLLADYLRAHSEAELAKGRSLSEIAPGVGYSSGHALRRALNRHWPDEVPRAVLGTRSHHATKWRKLQPRGR